MKIMAQKHFGETTTKKEFLRAIKFILFIHMNVCVCVGIHLKWLEYTVKESHNL